MIRALVEPLPPFRVAVASIVLVASVAIYCLAYTALVRYDAYGEMSGRQSSSLALLDSRCTGVVLSSILHRDQARVYVKHVHEGESQLELSPEEQEAIDTAMAPSAGAPADS